MIMHDKVISLDFILLTWETIEGFSAGKEYDPEKIRECKSKRSQVMSVFSLATRL